MTFKTFEAEAREFVAIAISDAETITDDMEAALTSPLISPFLPLLKTGMTTVLTAAGLPAAQIEAVCSQMLSLLNRVSQHAAAAVSSSSFHEDSSVLDKAMFSLGSTTNATGGK